MRKMNKDKEKCLESAIGIILSIVPTLTKLEWERISAIIDHQYTSKAAKVQLDGNDIETMKHNFETEVLGKPFIQSRPE